MSIQVKRIIIIGIIAIVAFVLGRLAVRALMNLLLGGTLFGGNILWLKTKKKGKEGKKPCLFGLEY